MHLDHTSFIDGYIAETKVMIEQKSLGKNLLAPIKQSDGTLLKPIEQAKRYAAELPVSQHPKWIVTCNFEKFLVYDAGRRKVKNKAKTYFWLFLPCMLKYKREAS